jgi:unsaturated chondroitin disaccharide hydrolase
MNRTEETSWAKDVWGKIEKKIPYSLGKAQEMEGIPYSSKDGNWTTGPQDGICWWTNGFWAALMWRMYLVTREESYKEEAIRNEVRLDEAFVSFTDLHHDVGFLWQLSSGVHMDLETNQESEKRMLLAATLLAGRYNPVGFLEAWNGEEHLGWAIIDCLMNLSLLYKTSSYTKNPRFKHIAVLHADMALKNFLQEDGSVHHIVAFDAENGEVVSFPPGQGYSSTSCWSRGQSWAVYGFLISYIHTGDQSYLKASCKAADFFCSHLTPDCIPVCDFFQPERPEIKDVCAGSIVASALLRLSEVEQVSEEKRMYYRKFSLDILEAIEKKHANWEHTQPTILGGCSSSYHNGQHDIGMVYADYFFLESISYLLGERMLFW